MGPAFACLVEKLQKIAQESKLAQKREARGQNLAEEGNLEAKMQSNSLKKQPNGSQKAAKRAPQGAERV